MPKSEWKSRGSTRASRIASLLGFPKGYRAGIFRAITIASIVLVANITIALLLITKYKIEDGRGTMKMGECSRIRRINTFTHLLINVMGTFLVGANNYCAQCLNAPTRSEIDRAHVDGRWLDIGIPSLRNVFRLSRKKAILWSLFMLTSIPLHLLFNSTVLTTRSMNEYQVYMANEDYIFHSKWLNSDSSTTTTTTTSSDNANLATATPASDPKMRRDATDLKQVTETTTTEPIEIAEPVTTVANSILPTLTTDLDLHLSLGRLSPSEESAFRVYKSMFLRPTTTEQSSPSIETADDTTGESKFGYGVFPSSPGLKRLQSLAQKGKLERLEVEDCAKGYLRSFQTRYRNVLLVSKSFKEDPIGLADDSVVSPFYMGLYPSWICGDVYTRKWNASYTWKGHLIDNGLEPREQQDCKVWLASIGQRNSRSKNETVMEWDVFRNKVDYCLSESFSPPCKLQFAIGPVITVVLLNVLKLGLMITVLYIHEEKPLLTVGDAVSSFLEKEDPTTKQKCLSSWMSVHSDSQLDPSDPAALEPKVFHYHRERWLLAASAGRWAACLLGIVAGLACFGTSLFARFSSNIKDYGLNQLWSVGFSAIDPRAFSSEWHDAGNRSVVGNAIIANVTQPVLSFLYLNYNAVLTAMLLAKEWDDYSKDRKPLRVSSDHKGIQRDSRFLQMPLRYGIPFLVLSGAIHWLVSQSLFPVILEVYDTQGHTSSSSVSSAIGMSLVACVATTCVVVFSIVLLVSLGFRRYYGYMPVASSCSLAISAACHPEVREPGMERLPLQWGVTRKPGEEDYVGHCSFSTGFVTLPLHGKKYAGKKSSKLE